MFLLVFAAAAGTRAQTTILDINVGPNGSDLDNVVVFNGMIYFAATTAADGRELWRSDGVTASLFADINMGPGSSDPMGLTVVGTTLFFGADDGIAGRELWKTDGTTTSMVADINVGPDGSDPQWLTPFNGEVFFSADNGSFAIGKMGRELWKSNGTTAVLVKDIFTGGIGFLGITNHGNPEELTVSNGTLFFRATSVDGTELWKSNGTIGNGVLVSNIFAGTSGLPPQPNSSMPMHLVDFGGTLFFAATTADGTELWESNGTAGTTLQVADIEAGPLSSNPENLLVIGSTLFFSASTTTTGVELFSSPGSGGGASIVANIRSGSAGSSPANFAEFGGELFFSANDGMNGVELWKSDGSMLGTMLVKNIHPSGNSSPMELTAITGPCSNGLAFRANDGTNGIELWATDGTMAGTQPVQNIRPGAASSNPGAFTLFGSIVFFRADDGTTGIEPAVISANFFGDVTPPVISGLPAPSTIECPAMPMFATPMVNDDTDPMPTLTFVDTMSGTCPVVHTRTWTATDACGNTSTASQEIAVDDTVAPVISALPAPSTIECPAVPMFDTPTAMDACDPMPTLTFVDTMSGTCPVVHTRTWTATDACGNTSTASQEISVDDTVAPVISALPAPSTIECPAVPMFDTPTAMDACDPMPTLTFVDTMSGTCPVVHTRTWTATDSCGNTSTASQEISVDDTIAPVISALPAPSTIECPAVPMFDTPTAMDACDPMPMLTFVDTMSGTCPVVHTRTWTATDACGNTSTASQEISVDDTVAPVISALPAPSTIECPAVPVFDTPTAMDACDPMPTLTFVDTVSGTCPVVHTRTWTATDSCGNTSTASQEISVDDTVAPVISALPAPSTIECPAVPVFDTPTAMDACDPMPMLTFVDTMSGTCPVVHTRTWTATDSCGNTSTASQEITVDDTVAPTVICPGQRIGCIVDGVATVPDFRIETVAVDACDPTVTLTQMPAPGTVLAGPPDVYSVTIVGTDDCGNTSSCMVTFITSDIRASVMDLGGACGAPDPALRLTYPVVGENWTLSITNVAPMEILFLVINAPPFITPMPFIGSPCVVYVDPNQGLLIGPELTSPAGDYALQSFLSETPVLLGAQVVFQAGLILAGGPFPNVMISNAVTMTFGSCPPYCTATRADFASMSGAGLVFDSSYETVFPAGIEIGNYDVSGGSAAPNGILFDGTAVGRLALKSFLANAGTSNAISADAVNPLVSPGGGNLAYEAAALTLNLGFNAAGMLGSTETDFGTLRYHASGTLDSLNGMTVNDILAVANVALATPGSAPMGYTYAQLANLLANINASFRDCEMSSFANTRLFR